MNNRQRPANRGRVAQAFALVLVTTIVGLALHHAPLWASDAARERVRIAVPERFPVAGAEALVIRYTSGDAGDVIILNRAAVSPGVLHAAARLLHRQRQKSAQPDRDQMAIVAGSRPIGNGAASASRRWQSVLDALARQPTARIGNLGPGQWIEVADLTAALK